MLHTYKFHHVDTIIFQADNTAEEPQNQREDQPQAAGNNKCPDSAGRADGNKGTTCILKVTSGIETDEVPKIGNVTAKKDLSILT